MVPTSEGTFSAGGNSQLALFLTPKEPVHEHDANPCATFALFAPLRPGADGLSGVRRCPCPRRVAGAFGGRRKPAGRGAAPGRPLPAVPRHLGIRRRAL